ncbi:MAG TPA: FHA domain-containing protein [Bacillota bacterium]
MKKYFKKLLGKLTKDPKTNNEGSIDASFYRQYLSDDPIEVVHTQPRLKMNCLEQPSLPLEDWEFADTKVAKFNFSRSRPRVKWVFKVITGVDQGRQYLATTPEVKVGRKPENHICLRDPKVSRFHAVIRIKDIDAVISDLGSANGTFVNGVKIVQPQKLFSGDLFKVGETTIQIVSEPW